MPGDYFAVKGSQFFKKTFYSTVLSTNIALYQYLANILFDGDLSRVVWASNDRTFRKRVEQVTKRSKGENIGSLDLPYCSFRLSQDGLENRAQNRPWFNQALNVEGEWIEELGRKVRQTPIQLKYEGVICLQHDTDVYLLEQLLIWVMSNETLLEPVLATVGDDGKPAEIKNIALTNITPHMNSRFSEAEWVTNNKIQTIDIDIQVDTYLLKDNREGYWLTKTALLQFAEAALPWHEIKSDRDGNVEEIIKAEIFS